MVRFLIIDFPQNICDDDYYIICLLCGNYMSLHCSMLSTCCNKATVPSVRYFNWQKNWVALINWQLTLCIVLYYNKPHTHTIQLYKLSAYIMLQIFQYSALARSLSLKFTTHSDKYLSLLYP